MFVIRKITYSGENVETSFIEFTDGLNIVYGPSNTGKTYIAETIDYMFGGEEFPLSDNTGYTDITLELTCEKGELTISRNKFKKTADVESKIDGIDSKEYFLKPGKGKKRKDTISDLWLSLLGISEPTEIYQTEDLKKQAFTTRSFNQIFIIKEDLIHQKDSIVIKGHKTITSIKAALLYLLNDDNYIVKEGEDNNTKKVKRKAVELYINEQLGYISAKRDELKKKTNLDVEDAKKQIDASVTELEFYESEMSEIFNRNKELYLKIDSLNSALSENQSLFKKYKALQTQYASDLKRLNLIIDGEIHSNSFKKPLKCPFCNGELKKKEEESCVDAAKVEIEILIPKINDLKKAESDLSSEIDNLISKINQINSEKDLNSKKINEELKPKINNLRNTIESLSKAIEDSKEAEMLLLFEERYKNKLGELKIEKKEMTKFEPNNLLGSAFVDKMNNNISSMLTSCNYENYNSSYFDINSFDIVVNGQTKKTQGKGFRAFLNTVLAFSLHTYLKENAIHFMNLFVIDSPILTLRERDDIKEIEEKKIADTMKDGLMKYFVENSDGRQVIIIENELPNIDYNNANIIHFTKSNDGRYGLLKSVK